MFAADAIARLDGAIITRERRKAVADTTLETLATTPAVIGTRILAAVAAEKARETLTD